MKRRILAALLICSIAVGQFAFVHADNNFESAMPQSEDVSLDFSEYEEEKSERKEHSRFIVKYKEGNKGKERTEEAVSEVYSKLKKEKKEKKLKNIRDNSRGKIKKIKDTYAEESQMTVSDNPRPDVVMHERDSDLLDINVIELGEEIDSGSFVEQITDELIDEVEYVIPDYEIELSSKDEEINNKDDNTETAENEEEQNVISEELTADIAVEEAVFEEEFVGLIDKESDIASAHGISNGEGIIVAVIDDGLDYSHEFFEGKIADGAWDFYNDTEYQYEYDGSMSAAHGTHIAGIIATVAPDSKILPVKVFENGSAYTSDIIEAIEYAEFNGASVVNCSWGCSEENIALKEAMEKSDMIFVASTGNNRLDLAETPIYPAMYNLDNTISVASINDDGGLSYYSNYSQQYADVAAWGRKIYSTLPNDEFGTMTGTSMSAAYVTGTVALMMSNGIDSSTIKYNIKASADKLSNLQDKIVDGNKLNITRSVEGIESAEIITVYPVDDFNTEGYDRTPQENWELFCSKDNVDIKAGTDFAVVLKGDGTVWTWGNNTYGQLGNSSTVASTDPVKVTGLSDVIQIASGRQHVLALKDDGTVWAWGYNGQGQLGISSTSTKTVPVQVTGLSDIQAISASGVCSMALKSDGTVWTWGYNLYGQAGNGTTSNNTAPVQAIGISDIEKIYCGECHAFAMSSDGVAYAWGYNSHGQIGTNSSGNVYVPVEVTVIDDIKDFAGGEMYTIILKNDGTVWAWGANWYGELGYGESLTSDVPMQVSGLKNVKAIYSANGGNTNFAVKENGTVWGWGYNLKGQIGNGTTSNCYTPVQVPGLEDIECMAVSDTFSAAICRDGTIRTWGNNSKGQLGYGRTLYSKEPIQAKGLSYVQEISDTAAVTSDGKLYTWGYNGYGQVGNGTTTDVSSPVLISSISNVIMCASSDRHKLAVTSDGSVYAWGYNGYGQLGNGSTTTLKVPTLISGISDVAMVSVGYNHSIALKSDGTVWTWGYNNYGQLGNGTTTTSKSPIQVSGLTDIIAVSAGNYHNIALKSDGTVYTWGYNNYGQLGNNTSTTAKTPVKLTTISGITAISAGTYHSMALKSDGTVYTWGYNLNGQLGNGTTTTSKVPVLVSALTDVTDIDAGGYNSAAVTSDGILYTWGYNGYGQIGNGTKTNAKTPVSENGLINIVNVSVSNYSSYGNTVMVVESDGTVYASGSNLNYQLAQEDIMTQTTPEIISGDMSDIQGDSFASAHEIEAPYQNTAYINYAKDYDFYKFIPTVSGTYKMYTEGSLDTYGHLYNSAQTQLTYNDDAGDGTNFLISYTLTAGQTYYLKARAYSTTRTGTYTIHIINAESNSTASYTSGVIYPISISAQNIENVAGKTFCVEYDSSKFEVYDLCAFTEYQDTEEGYISGTGIKILRASNGEIRFSVDNEFELSSFSGIVNIIRLKAKTTGSHNINVRVQ